MIYTERDLNCMHCTLPTILPCVEYSMPILVFTYRNQRFALLYALSGVNFIQKRKRILFSEIGVSDEMAKTIIKINYASCFCKQSLNVCVPVLEKKLNWFSVRMKPTNCVVDVLSVQFRTHFAWVRASYVKLSCLSARLRIPLR